MQSAGVAVAVLLLGVGLVLNTTVLLYFVLRSLRQLSVRRRSRTVAPRLVLGPAHR